MSQMIYLFIVLMLFLLFYVLIGPELMANTLLFLILLAILGSYNNENQDHYQMNGIPVNWVHSPASTSAQTVKLQLSQTDNSGTSAYINRSNMDSDAAWMGRYVSTLTVFEVSG